jgi:O-antigen biosynthesis protein WbqP
MKSYDMIKRVFDVLVALAAGVLLLPLTCLVALVIAINDPGPPIFWSRRVGSRNRIFLMPKFRTMRADAPQLPTHLMTNPEKWLTSVGPFLRKSSLDEIPQMWSILKGDMSLVGPRPALFNQDDLVALRSERGVDAIRPGLTGWAQVNGRDTIPIPEKVALDEYYLNNRSMGLDLKIIWLTVRRVLGQRDISH